MKKILCAVIFAAGVFTGCATVAGTGRTQLALVPTSAINTQGKQIFDDIIKNAKVITTGPDAKMLAEVGKRIARAAEDFLRSLGREREIANYTWEFKLIEDSTVNAFCLPGGKVAIYTGILPFTKNADGLAVVVSHEVAHVIANHGAERMSQALLANIGGSILSQLTKDQSNTSQALIMAAYGVGANVGVLLPYSRRHEYEADRIGLILMAKAGYNPDYAITFWERMSSGGSGSDFFSTHPSDANRIAEIRKNLPEARKHKR